MREITVQANNNINIVGKLLSATFGDGTMSDGRRYERASLTVRVNQKIENNLETDEIPVSIFAAQFTKTGKPNPMYENIQRLKDMKTIQNVGIDNADWIRLSKANLQENPFVARNGQFYNGWQIRGAFCGKASESPTEIASFAADLFVLDMRDEVNSEGDTTGRLIVKGGLVQYGGALDVLEFVVEDPTKIDFIQRTWEVNNTVGVVGRIRVTTKEDHHPAATSSWGEVLEEDTTRLVRELVITGGAQEPYEEEFAYDSADIKKAFNIRKAKIEQMQIDARNGANKTTQTSTKKAAKYDWE